jgi:hypothetical protein
MRQFAAGVNDVVLSPQTVGLIDTDAAYEVKHFSAL